MGMYAGSTGKLLYRRTAAGMLAAAVAACAAAGALTAGSDAAVGAADAATDVARCVRSRERPPGRGCASRWSEVVRAKCPAAAGRPVAPRAYSGSVPKLSATVSWCSASPANSTCHNGGCADKVPRVVAVALPCGVALTLRVLEGLSCLTTAGGGPVASELTHVDVRRCATGASARFCMSPNGVRLCAAGSLEPGALGPLAERARVC